MGDNLANQISVYCIYRLKLKIRKQHNSYTKNDWPSFKNRWLRDDKQDNC